MLSPDILLDDYYAQFYERLKLMGKSANTRRLYRVDLRVFAKFLGRPATLADLNDDTVSALLAWIVGRGRSPATANKARNQILAIWRFAARKQHIEQWPDVEPLAEYKRIPTAYSPEQVGRLLVVAQSCSNVHVRHLSPGAASGLWWSALILTLYDTGIRIGAALQLIVADFDTESQTLYVRAEIQKQKADQVLHLSDQATQILAELIAAQKTNRLFHWPFSTATLYYRLNTLLRLAGLPRGRRDKFHKLRRTSATLAEIYAGRGAATQHLGHSSPRITAGYIDTSMLPEMNVAAKLPRPQLENDLSSDDQLILLAPLVAEYTASQPETKWGYTCAFRVQGTFDECGFKVVADLDGAAMMTRLDSRGLRPDTLSHYQSAIRCFLRWLVIDRRILGATLGCLSVFYDQQPASQI